ncbi:immune inhibitor A domain-containing protein [Halomarina halobia]|uniref:Immune inhibitor A domain-containing protein n=1 Tax=Halomarina halobia TaxID=3033386 RepID=A0ABD6AB87_9EURY|nr:immune inhibitor A domain-containing protein [Halomarina sp. PSR21]
MRICTIVLTALVVASTATVWIGGAAGGVAPSPENASASVAGTNPAERPVEYRPAAVTPNDTRHPVDANTLPEDAAGASGVGTSAAGSGGEAGSTDAREGQRKYFLALDYASGGYYFKEFTLRKVGDGVEIWVAEDLAWSSDDPRETPQVTDEQLDYLAAEFDGNIHPTETELFGEPAARNGTEALDGALGLPENYWRTDGQGRSVVLVDNVRDENYYDADYPNYVAGFYSPTIQRYTDRNVVTVDAYDWQHRVGPNDAPWKEPGDERNLAYLVEGTFAHEYQHLIHGDLDPDETTWVNEGLSDFAEYAVGYGHPEGHVSAFEASPDNSLVEWEDEGAVNVLADYGHAYLFQLYLYEQYGEEVIAEIARDDANGIASVEGALDARGHEGDFYSLYQDFTTATVTDGLGNANKPRYEFRTIDLDVNTTDPDREAAAWGASHTTVDAAGEGPVAGVTVDGVDFTGTAWTTAADPTGSGDDVLYSGRGNLLDNRAIFAVDLADAENPALTFETYYDIERAWDYGFVQVSTDGGETWTSLENGNTSTELADGAHPDVAANAPGFTGSTNGAWVTEEFDLSAYAGREVLVAFRYRTDWAVANEGWYVRDVAVSGTDVSYDGSSAAPFRSLREVREDYVEYQFTTVGVTNNGNYRVQQLDMRTFDAGDAEELKKFLRNGNFEEVVVSATWAAPEGDTGTVPYDVDLEFRQTGKRGGNGGGNDGNGPGNVPGRAKGR